MKKPLLMILLLHLSIQRVHSSEPASKNEKVGMYILNAPTSFLGGFLGFAFGVVIGGLVSMPVNAISGGCKFSLGGHDGGSTNCAEGGLITTNALLSIGGIIGTTVGVHYTSRFMGLRQKFWHALIGATVGIIPFSYYYYRVTHWPSGSDSIDGSRNPHMDYGSISVVLSALLATYIGSIYHEFDDAKLLLNTYKLGNEPINQVGFQLKF